jgi:TetR/AcrR family transcriptional regulator, lmrAB and yxaGH operons repressor
MVVADLDLATTGMRGSSLADLSRATGLGKSSLYHHLPRGKEQMAEAVLEQVRTFIQTAIAEVAKSAAPLKERIRKIIAALDELYASGRNPCLLGRLAVSESVLRVVRSPVKFQLRGQMRLQLLLARAACRRASRANSLRIGLRVQSSLILYAANGDCGPFERAMAVLRDLSRPAFTL